MPNVQTWPITTLLDTQVQGILQLQLQQDTAKIFLIKTNSLGG